MAPKQPCAKYQYVVTASGPKILPVDEPAPKDEESPADYNTGGYLPVKVNDVFSDNRYRIVRKLGWGHFSTVWLVKDALTLRHSALKVVKSAGRYAETARDEIKLLSRVSSVSPLHPGREYIVSFLDSFSHQGPESSHICIVFEPLGENLLALIERHKKKGVPRSLVRVIARQMILGLEYLHEECDLVHTDIKPENVLISIPDIERHIQTEVSQSPSPTSRRVGVPVKSRTGVTIPNTQQRSRRQVQIFHSQPLSSPRSAGAHASLDNSGSGSVSSSYIAQMQMMSRMGSVYGGSPGTSAPKVPSALSILAHQDDLSLEQQKATQAFTAKGVTPIPAKVVNSPSSTSSSSSSISSTMASTAAGTSSLVSTPPTSLSHSAGNVVELFGVAPLESELRTGTKAAPCNGKMEEERAGLAIPVKIPRTELETELSQAISSSWKDKISGSFTSQKSAGSLSKLKNGHTHDQSRSGLSNTNFWKDPGTGAPAPAVLVSAVVGADGLEDGFTKLSTVDSRVATPSESSSATTTVVRPSPVGTPPSITIPSSRNTSLDDDLKTSNPKLTTTYNQHTNANISHSNDQRTTSLLSQTAPRPTSSSKRTIIRISPPQQVSQLSAHMHRNKPPLNCACSDLTHNHEARPHSSAKSRSSRLSGHSIVSPTDSVPFTLFPAPPAPPPTPVEPHPICAFIPPFVMANDPLQKGSDPRKLPHLQTTLENKPLPPPISVKIADLGNATPSKKHFTEDIQTRQYRAPEAILGRRDWDARADIWSVACVIFELLTAEYLFDPQGQGELFSKDDDHMAQIIELLGDFPLEVKMGGKYSRELFDHTGALRYIKTLKPWPMKRVMIEKYLFNEVESVAFCEFLQPMLAVNFRERVNARDMKDHKWLEVSLEDGIITEW